MRNTIPLKDSHWELVKQVVKKLPPAAKSTLTKEEGNGSRPMDVVCLAAFIPQAQIVITPIEKDGEPKTLLVIMDDGKEIKSGTPITVNQAVLFNKLRERMKELRLV